MLHLLANQRNASLSASTADFLLEYLTSSCLGGSRDPEPPYAALRALSKLLASFGNKVTSSERTAQSVVRPLMLPLIERAAGGAHAAVQCRCAALDCMAGLLRHPTQASAMFSPLVVDVRDDGR
jgi:hypothetical protein